MLLYKGIRNGQLKHTHYLIGVLFLIKGIPPVVMYNKNGVLDLLHSSKMLRQRLSSCISCNNCVYTCNLTPALYYFSALYYVTLLSAALKRFREVVIFKRCTCYNVLKWEWMHFVDTRVWVLKANILGNGLHVLFPRQHNAQWNTSAIQEWPHIKGCERLIWCSSCIPFDCIPSSRS